MNFSFLLLLLLPLGPVAGMPQSKINFQTGDLEMLKARAAKESKPLFVHFTANWCMPCQWMETNTFTDDRLAELVNTNFLPVLVDIDDPMGLRTKQKYRIAFLPSMLILDTRGVVVARYEESMPAPRLYQLLDRNYRELTGRPAALALSATPPLNTPPQPATGFSQPAGIQETSGAASPLSNPAPERRQMALAPTPPRQSTFGIQVGVFSDYQNAQRLVKDLEQRFKQPVNIFVGEYNQVQVYRILLGVFDSREAALTFARTLEKEAINGLVKNLNEF